MGVDIDISTEQNKEFAAGEIVTGSVNMTVSGSNGSSANGLILQLIGKSKTCVTYTTTISNGSSTTTQTHTATQSKEFLKFDVTLTDFGGRADAGTHGFPFAMQLPPNLPSTMKESNGSDTCEVEYTLKARLHRPGLLHFDAKDKHEISVFARSREVTAAPVLVGPDTTAVTKCCCFKSGSMSIGFRADRSVVGRNERLGLNVVARNDSSSSVKEMRVVLVQKTEWCARGHRSRKKRVLSSVVIPGSELGAAGQKAELGGARGRSPTAVADAAKRDLQELLSNGAGTRHELILPEDNCLDTLSAGDIDVSHTLEVSLKTHTFITSPELTMSVIVQRLSAELQTASEEAVPLALKYGGEAPGANAYGNTEAVQVPESAVKIKFDTSPDPLSRSGLSI